MLLLFAVLVADALPFGTLPEDPEVLELRQRVANDGSARIPPERLTASDGAASDQCRFYRLGPGPRFARDVKLRFSRPSGGVRRDGFPVDAQLVEGAFSPESNKLALWFDSRGQLVGTATLPPPVPHENERPGTREEFIVVRYLPATRELLAEWQRAVGPNPKESAFASLPHALLVDPQAAYSSYLRASAYMLCRPPRDGLPPLRPAGTGSERATDATGGTRQPGP